MINEHSPLIGAEDTGEDGDVEDATLSNTFKFEDSVVESKSTLYLILLTLSIGGLQIVWSVEMSNGSPYLLSLGMSKALLAFVWLAGPLTGVLVQPYIGIISDRSRNPWGKRKPFMIAGTLGTVVSSLLLAYARDIVWLLGPWSGDAEYDGWWRGLTIAFATIMMWCLDFAINTVQAAIRAFIVDNAPAHQQESANAWASRLTGIGNVLGYIFGYLDLPKYFHFFGRTQFTVLCVIASIALSSTILISIMTIQERNPQDDPPTKADYESSGLVSFFQQVFRTMKRLSPTVKSVCQIQFFHWIGWFPFLFYITTYIGQLYVNPRIQPGMTDAELDELWAQATRVGTLALLVYAIVSFSANIVLPLLVVPTYEKPLATTGSEITRTVSSATPVGTRHRAASYSEMAHAQLSASMSSNSGGGATGRSRHQLKPPLSTRILKMIQIPGLTLRRTWLMTQLLHAACMFTTFFISTPTAGIVMVAVVGIAWALTLWAPFALISGDIARQEERRRLHDRRQGLLHGAESGSSHEASSVAGVEADVDDAFASASAEDEEGQDSAGIILGLHNVAVSAPQVVATLLSSAIFKALQKGRGEPGDVSVAWTLRVGGVAALVAAWFTWRMKERSH